jgi:hypothetical protein
MAVKVEKERQYSIVPITIYFILIIIYQIIFLRPVFRCATTQFEL